MSPMRLAVASDERLPITEAVVRDLEAAGHQVDRLADGQEWPEVGRAVGEAVVDGTADLGIVFCHTGTGVSIAANKVPGVRAALCGDPETARGARRWNDANVLALALSSATPEQTWRTIEAFLSEPSDPAEASAIARVER